MRRALWPELSICLFVVFLTAKIAATILGISDGNVRFDGPHLWWLPALFSEDARATLWLVASGLCLFVIDRFLPLRHLPRWNRFCRRLAIVTYAGLAIYTAINVPVTRTMGTPLTYSILRAAGGALSDSLLIYLTPSNVFSTVAVLAMAAFAPIVGARFLSRHIAAVRLTAVIVSSLLLVLGPRARQHVTASGLSRNALLVLFDTTLQQRAPSSSAFAIAPLPQDEATSKNDIDLSPLTGSAKGRSVIWIVLESTAAQYLGVYGAPRDPMPNLHALAQEGLVFRNAYAAYPESIKGLFSMLCATYPAAHTPVEKYTQDRHPCSALSEVFGAAGYRTAMFHSGWFAYLGMDGIVRDRGLQTLVDAGKVGGAYARSFGVDEASTVRRLLDFVDDARRQAKPFFVMYLPIAGHHPYVAPGPEDRPRPFGDSRDEDRYHNDLFLGDQALGQLRDGIARRGLADQIVWVVSGDHGEAFHQHPGNFAHTLFLYEENVHVPLVIAAPGLPALSALRGDARRPLAVSKVASVIDIAPTLLSLCGIPVPPRYQGRSLLGGNGDGVARFLIDHAMFQVGLRQGRWKFIHEMESGRSQLFDVEADPAERRDLAREHPQRVTRYRDHLRAFTLRQRASIAGGHD